MAYVDGFLLPVPKRNRARYRKMSTQAGKVWMDHGALGYHECVADDVPWGKTTSFPRGMKDPRLAHMMDPKAMPFDSKRMVFGGFRMVVKF
jgi:uncharacterized protein YbaA (DUF1428 family)